MKHFPISYLSAFFVYVIFFGASYAHALSVEEREIPSDNEYLDQPRDQDYSQPRQNAPQPIDASRPFYENASPYHEAVDNNAPSVNQSLPPTSPRSTIKPSAQGASSPNWEMVSQIESLQQEVQQLRGMIEELNYRIEQTSKQQKEQYLDLDHRINEAQKGAAKGGSSDDNSQDTSAAVSVDQFASEEEAYRDSQKLIKEKKLPEAERSLLAFISQYPNSTLTANAHYWLGEVYLAAKKPDLAKAKKHFQVVIDQYPKNTKTAVAMYKLAMIHDELGEPAKARVLLEGVIKKFPNTPPANMAKKYLGQIKK